MDLMEILETSKQWVRFSMFEGQANQCDHYAHIGKSPDWPVGNTVAVATKVYHKRQQGQLLTFVEDGALDS